MKKVNIELYKKIYLIRQASEKICEHYMEDEMRTPVHLSVGEEAIAAGVCQALNFKDQLFGSYRSHGIYLSRTLETDRFFAELYGKKDGVAKGKAGSMHLSAPESNIMGTSAIVGSMIPVAVGTAFANKYKKDDRLVAVFFGDGALDEGTFWESINFACLKKLPIIFVCEDNGLAVHTSTSKRQGYDSITDVVSQFRCNVFKAKTTDPENIYQIVQKAIKMQKQNHKPCFLHFKYYRYYEHVGTFKDFKFGYRSEKEFEKWYKVDPINLQRKKLLEKKYCSEKEIGAMEKKIDKQIEKSMKLAQAGLFPDESELFTDVYA